jgi:hypothetical protein
MDEAAGVTHGWETFQEDGMRSILSDPRAHAYGMDGRCSNIRVSADRTRER